MTNDTLLGHSFNNCLWRNLISDACKIVDSSHLGLQVISPWGFEVINDKSFLSKKLKRFYCYIGVPNIKIRDKNKIAAEYANVLYAKIKEVDPQMYKDIVLFVDHDKFRKINSDNYICLPTDKLIDVQIRPIKEDIFCDYADYLICTLSGMLEGKGESKEIMKNKVFRWRFYQLYIIQENLFGYLLPPLTEEQLKIYRSIFILTDNMIQVFYSPHLMFCPANLWEIHVIDTLIKERLNLIKNVIKSNDKSQNITIRSISYHIEEEMEITLKEDIYQSVLSKIKETYLKCV